MASADHATHHMYLRACDYFDAFLRTWFEDGVSSQSMVVRICSYDSLCQKWKFEHVVSLKLRFRLSFQVAVEIPASLLVDVLPSNFAGLTDKLRLSGNLSPLLEALFPRCQALPYTASKK